MSAYIPPVKSIVHIFIIRNANDKTIYVIPRYNRLVCDLALPEAPANGCPGLDISRPSPPRKIPDK